MPKSPHTHSQTITEGHKIRVVCLANAARDDWVIENLDTRRIWDFAQSQSESVQEKKNSTIQTDVVTLKHTSQTTNTFSILTFITFVFPTTSEEHSPKRICLSAWTWYSSERTGWGGCWISTTSVLHQQCRVYKQFDFGTAWQEVNGVHQNEKSEFCN